MPRIHLLVSGETGPRCYQDCTGIDLVDEAEFRRMMRNGYSTLCPECEAEMGKLKLERKG